jgi:BMFP domain-containing protein YqiC
LTTKSHRELAAERNKNYELLKRIKELEKRVKDLELENTELRIDLGY